VPTLLLNLSGRVSNLTDNLVVGAILDTARVNSLFNTQRLAVLGQTVLTGVGKRVVAGPGRAARAEGERGDVSTAGSWSSRGWWPCSRVGGPRAGRCV